MAVERPAGRSGRGNSLLMSALRFAGYDLDCRPATPTSETKATEAGAVSAGGRYMHTLPADVEATRTLLEEYSGIPAEDVDRHVYEMRDRLWDIYPYACVGRFRFLSLEFTMDAYYQVALFRLLRAQTESESDDNETRLLDVGCCVGQVLRKLAFDGVHSSRLYGTDIEPRFLDMGYDLFRDRDKFQGGFVVGDLLKQEEGDDRLGALDRRMTFIHATSFFHLFTWDDQVRAATRMVRFLQPERQDAMIFGRQVGTTLPRNNGKAGSDKVYLHNANSWQRLWDEVGERTGTKWRTTMEPTETIETGAGGVESSLRKMSFCVVRG
ncbi:hypothetical protein ANO14919_031860 [Xylariales sp. No.14919]|nr:hypothetical protein F5X98DRAFT_312586 [Xylaria grammica]GAW13796.1 hypothetical protein ANO14919_031860 [Xylariales sp. No.14919]